MKSSKYNFLFDIDNKEFFVYNTHSNALIEIDEETYSTLQRLKSSELSKTDVYEELYEILVSNGILTENDEDDYLKYKASIASMRGHRGYMHLTLAPTMECCFNCYYCFEKCKEKNYMTPNVMESIVKYISLQPDLENIKLTWFGGEPLMALSEMEEFYNKLTHVWRKTIQSNVITTGYHINEEVIAIFKKINISQVQITLDGLKETHNKIKYLASGEDVFSKVWSNIELLSIIAPEINVVIRVNLTLRNAHEYTLLLEKYYETFKNQKNVAIAPAFVLDRGADNCEVGDKQHFLFKHDERSRFILDLAQRGIGSPFLKYPERFFNECAIRNNVAISFDPKGNAYKCWEVIGNEAYSIGRLNSDGQLVDINLKILNRQLYGADPMDDPVCVKCKYLPICGGGCPIQRIQNKYEGGHNNVCTYYRGFLIDFLKLHITRKRQIEKIAKAAGD